MIDVLFLNRSGSSTLFESFEKLENVFECHCVLLCRALLKGRETDLLNLRGFSSPSCGKIGPALLVFSHGSGAPVILRVRGRR